MNTFPTHALIGVVDDDESIRSGTTSLLRSAGYATESFGSAEAFLESGDHRRFACVVADIQMPGMSGIELADKLGNENPPTPVVLVTARTEKDILAHARESKASFLLCKPFDGDRLLNHVQSLIARRSADGRL